MESPSSGLDAMLSLRNLYIQCVYVPVYNLPTEHIIPDLDAVFSFSQVLDKSIEQCSKEK